MSDQRPTDEGDWGERDLDPHERADAEINLDDPSAGDDEPWSPPERQPRGAELIGVETDGGESLSQRIRQEEPEEGTAYGAPSGSEAAGTGPEQIDMLGGDDPDAIPAEDDVLGGSADRADTLGVDEVDRDSGSPEERAMRVEE